MKSDLKKHDNISREYNIIKSQNEKLNEGLLDLQTRSMQDNSLIFGIEEGKTFEDRTNENCIQKVHQFFDSVLHIEKASEIKLDRAHRLGNYKSDKTRPIVVKFNFYQDKLRVKQGAYSKLQNTSYRISDQYPREIQERRKQLYPILNQAKAAGKRAILRNDKLFIDGRLYRADDPRSQPTSQ